MDKVAFTDGERIGVFDGTKVTYFESEYIKRYRDYLTNRNKNDEWKYTGEGARFRGDYERFSARQNEKVYAYVNGVQWDGENIIYSFTVNESSGVYRKRISEQPAKAGEQVREDHILSTSDEEILSVCSVGDTIAVTIKRGFVSSIGTLGASNAELKTLTAGDARDANAFISPNDPTKIYFDSAGAGMDSDGNFTGKFSPSAICSFNLGTLEIEELLRDEKKSYFRPKIDANGTLYCIERPTKEKKSGNVFLDILLFPVRIFQAIAMFIQSFVVMFTGKSLTSEGSNPAKGRESNSRKIFIDGNIIEADKELKRNKKNKDKEYGFIPLSWKLVKVIDGKTEIVKSGICDFDFTVDGGLYCTNGKHIFYIKDGKSQKICDTDSCLCVATPSAPPAEVDFFAV